MSAGFDNAFSAKKPSQHRRTRIFISYSRHDKALAERICVGLNARQVKGAEGFEAFLDVRDVEGAEKWWERLQALITKSDVFLFLMSPASLASEVCAREVEEADRQGKRIVPVVIREPGHGTPIPHGLQSRNYIFLNNPETLKQAWNTLIRALQQDIGWLREHTRLGELAERWASQNRQRSQLLRGRDIDAAEQWLAACPATAPEPSSNQRAFIEDSRRAAIASTRRLAASLAGIAVVLAGLATGLYFQRVAAEQERGRAEAAAAAEVGQRRLAEKNAARAAREKEQADLKQAQVLAEHALKLAEDGEAGRAAFNALLALPDPAAKRDMPYLPLAEHALYAALQSPFPAMGITPEMQISGGKVTSDRVVNAWFSCKGLYLYVRLKSGELRTYYLRSEGQPRRLSPAGEQERAKQEARAAEAAKGCGPNIRNQLFKKDRREQNPMCVGHYCYMDDNSYADGETILATDDAKYVMHAEPYRNRGHVVEISHGSETTVPNQSDERTTDFAVSRRGQWGQYYGVAEENGFVKIAERGVLGWVLRRIHQRTANPTLFVQDGDFRTFLMFPPKGEDYVLVWTGDENLTLYSLRFAPLWSGSSGLTGTDKVTSLQHTSTSCDWKALIGDTDRHVALDGRPEDAMPVYRIGRGLAVQAGAHFYIVDEKTCALVARPSIDNEAEYCLVDAPPVGDWQMKPKGFYIAPCTKDNEMRLTASGDALMFFDTTADLITAAKSAMKACLSPENRKRLAVPEPLHSYCSTMIEP